MSTIPLELPLKPSEAAAVADLVFQHAEGRLLNDDLRTRLATRVAGMGLSSLRPYWGSLQQDPVHSGTYYLAAQTVSGGTATFLLRLALASAPASGLFPKAMLIGRMRPGGGREVVVNAIPFSLEDTGAIRTFAEQVDRSFLPRPIGGHPSIIVSGDPSVFVNAFDAFRKILKQNGVNVAAIAPRPLEAGLWAAILTGWREGYGAEAERIVAASASPEEIERVKQQAAESARYTRFVVDVTAFAGTDERVRVCEAVFDAIRVARSELGLGRVFDFDLVRGDAREEWSAVVQSLKQRGRVVGMEASGLRLRGASAEAMESLAASLRS